MKRRMASISSRSGTRCNQYTAYGQRISTCAVSLSAQRISAYKRLKVATCDPNLQPLHLCQRHNPPRNRTRHPLRPRRPAMLRQPTPTAQMSRHPMTSTQLSLSLAPTLYQPRL